MNTSKCQNKPLSIKFLAFLLLAIVGAEFYARYALGLGDPPVSIADPEVDYLFAPNQTCSRFGNRIVYNNASMRCDFDVKADVGKKIFIVGDSVINGGALTDHKNLATTYLQERIDPTRKSIQVCNVSAGSWGPGNYAAYFIKFRSIVSCNDIFIVEVNSHDLWEDDPRDTAGANVGVDIAFPSKRPICALWDGFDRYLMPRIRAILGLSAVNTKVDVPKWGKDVDLEIVKYNLRCLDAVYALSGNSKYMLIYKSRAEVLSGKISLGESVFRQYAATRGIGVIEANLNPETDYRDLIHPNESGQLKIAKAIELALNTNLK